MQNFTTMEQEQIELGLKNGLTNEQIAVYAKKEFTENHMKEIRLGYKHGLTDEQVATYANKKFWAEQMREIRYGYQNKLTEEQVKIYAKPDVKSSVMNLVRQGLESGLTNEKAKEIADFDFAKHGIMGEEQIKLVCRCLLRGYDKGVIRSLIRISGQTRSYYGTRVNFGKLELCLKGLLNGFTLEKVKVYAKAEFCLEQVREIYWGLLKGLSIEEVEAYADKSISPARMKKIREILLKMKYRIN